MQIHVLIIVYIDEGKNVVYYPYSLMMYIIWPLLG